MQAGIAGGRAAVGVYAEVAGYAPGNAGRVALAERIAAGMTTEADVYALMEAENAAWDEGFAVAAFGGEQARRAARYGAALAFAVGALTGWGFWWLAGVAA